MARRIPWRRVCPELVKDRIEEALQARIYLLRETGPTGFLVKEDGIDKKFKLSLVEREINEVIRGAYLHSSRGNGTKSTSFLQDGREKLKQKQVTEEDVCPICQEEFLNKPEPLTYCKYGCGNSIHIKCMKVWAEHQKSTGETIIKCPLCRVDFGTFQELMTEYHNSSRKKTRANRQDLHLGATCQKCKMCPIVGKCFRCVVCADYHLCQQCFPTDTHMQHNFQFRQKPSQRWRSAARVSSLPSAVVSELQNREITDNDYDLLLQLDRPVVAEGVPGHVISSFPAEVIREKHKLLTSGKQCQVCLQGYKPFNCIRTLPCRHEFHRECIDNWLTNHLTCPTDGLSVSVVSRVSGSSQSKGFGDRLLQKRNTVSGRRLSSYETDPNLAGLPTNFALNGSSLFSNNKSRPTNRVQVRPPSCDAGGSSPTTGTYVDTSTARTGGASGGVQLVFDPSACGRPPQPSGEMVGKRSTALSHRLRNDGENRSNYFPFPPGESHEKRNNSGDSRKSIARSQISKRKSSSSGIQDRRSSSEGDLGLTAMGTALQSSVLESPIRKKTGQLMRGKLLSYNAGVAYSNPDLSTEPIVASGISLCLPAEMR